MPRLRNKDSWQWVAYVSGIGAAVLFLLLLYAPNGSWKLALLIMIIVAVGVILANPRYRLLALGTSTVLTGLTGLVAELTATVSATLPSGGAFTAGVEGGTSIPPYIFVLVLLIGGAMVTIDKVGRGWLWPHEGLSDPKQPDLSFVLEAEVVDLSSTMTNAHYGRFHLRLSASKGDGRAVRIVRANISHAEDVELGVGLGDGVQTGMVIDRETGCEVSVLGVFPYQKLWFNRARRKLIIVDEFQREWDAGRFTLRRFA